MQYSISSIYCFAAVTGAKLWVAPTGNFVYSTPAVDNGKVYIISGDRKLEAFNVATGAHLWSFTSKVEGLNISPAAANGVVYYPSDGRLYAFDGTTGKILWRAVPGAGYAPAIANGIIYTSTDGGLMAFNVKTGRLLWSYLIPYNQQGSVVCSVTIDNGMLYVGTSYGYLDAFHLQGTNS